MIAAHLEKPTEDLWFDGYWLRHLREQHGHTQKELGRTVAQMLGRPKPFCGVAVHNWETNKREPSTSVLIALCRIYNVPAWSFANGPDATLPSTPVEVKIEALDAADPPILPPHHGWIAVLKEIGEVLSKAATSTKNGRVYRPTEKLVQLHHDVTAGLDGARRILDRAHQEG